MMLSLLWLLSAATIERYAIVVGANDGGPQQERLRFAEADADKVAAVLVELGEVQPANTRLLKQPTPTQVLSEIALLEEKLRAHPPAATMLIFYYSGHAKASGLSLAGDELPLSTLRERLERFPAEVRLVLLDACQSGAFARAKSAARTADFSYNSVDSLTVTGTAVLASSSASELSQEADDAAGSYFTHNLVSALRGAADADDDGKVTLDEAYRYTHARTLEDTVKTRVGSQHVTFDTSLRGQGGLTLTTMPKERRRVLLPAQISGRVLIAREDSGAIMADIKKAKGEQFSVTLPVGRYRSLVRSENKSYACALDVREGRDSNLELASCKRIPDPQWSTKGQGRPRPPFALELGIGLGQMVDDSFDARLRLFAYEPKNRPTVRFQFQGAALWNALPFLSLLVEAMMLEQMEYNRNLSISDAFVRQSYAWRAFGVAAGIRATLWLLNDWVNPYVQLGFGPAFVLSTFRDSATFDSSELTVGFVLHPALGCNFMFHPRVGLFTQVDWYFAPVLRNLMNETHQSGGFAGTLGLRVGL